MIHIHFIDDDGPFVIGSVSRRGVEELWTPDTVTLENPKVMQPLFKMVYQIHRAEFRAPAPLLTEDLNVTLDFDAEHCAPYHDELVYGGAYLKAEPTAVVYAHGLRLGYLMQVLAHELGHIHHYVYHNRDFMLRTESGLELYADNFQERYCRTLIPRPKYSGRVYFNAIEHAVMATSDRRLKFHN